MFGRLLRLSRRPQLRSWSSKATKEARGIPIAGRMSVAELADQLGKSPAKVLTTLRKGGDKVKGHDTVLRVPQIESVVTALGHTPLISRQEVLEIPRQNRDEARLVPRPPIVTVMGHVDHGKTSLLDSLRQTAVAAGEAGGITQHIGAFTVRLSGGESITFLDTPGHAAFTTMRARGAQCTDIVVLVVAADDGVMEQTQESIRLTQDADVPLVVAINKCDKHGIDIGRVKSQLLREGVQLEEFGGDVQAVQVSALEGTGLDVLEEAIIALSEVSNLRANREGQVQGVVIESKLDKGLGPVSTVIVQQGSLRPGDVVVAGESWGKMRILLDQNRKQVKQAPPSMPVLTVGWKDLPAAGDEIIQAGSEQEAREVCESRAAASRHLQERERLQQSRPDDQLSSIVPLIVRGDVAGSVEALVELLTSRQPEQLDLSVVHTGVGGVTESDVEMAASSGAYVLAFNSPVSKPVATLAKSKRVHIISHNVIYKLLDSLKAELEARLPPVWIDEVIGEAVVLKVFQLTGARRASVGGCRVKQGRLVHNARYRLLRNDEVVHEGPITGLKQGKEDVESARKETECGVSFTNDPGFQEGDILVCFNKKKQNSQLNWSLGF